MYMVIFRLVYILPGVHNVERVSEFRVFTQIWQTLYNLS